MSFHTTTISDLAPPPSFMRKRKKAAHRGTKICKKATITFYNIIRLHVKKNLKIRRKPEASDSFLPRKQGFSLNFA